jgi:hypothetical protein
MFGISSIYFTTLSEIQENCDKFNIKKVLKTKKYQVWYFKKKETKEEVKRQTIVYM